MTDDDRIAEVGPNAPRLGDRLLQLVTLGLFVGAALLLLGANGPVGRWREARAAAAAHQVAFTAARAEALSIGQVLGAERPGADLLLEFFDYECPFCREVEKGLSAWREAHPGVKVVRVQYPLPSHPAGERAALAVTCAKSFGDRQKLHEALMATTAWITDPADADYATMAGAQDHGSFESCMSLPETRAEVERGLALGRALGVRGTPTFVGSGGTVVGAGDLARLDSVVLH